MKAIDRLEIALKRLEAVARKSTDVKYNRSAKFEFKIKPNWQAMPNHTRANTSRRTNLLIAWCDKHCQGSYSYDGVTVGFSFVLASDAMLFKLTWG